MFNTKILRLFQESFTKQTVYFNSCKIYLNAGSIKMSMLGRSQLQNKEEDEIKHTKGNTKFCSRKLKDTPGFNKVSSRHAHRPADSPESSFISRVDARKDRVGPRPNSHAPGVKTELKCIETESTVSCSEQGQASGKTKDFAAAENHLTSKYEGKRRRHASSSEEQATHQQKTSSPGSYRSNKKWRKLQRGPIEIRNSLRRWHQVKQVPDGSPGMELTLMSYNILAQELLEMHPDLYIKCQRRDLAWPNRGAAILREIISHNPDIVCLQEVQADHWRGDILPILKSRGYVGFYEKRNGDKPDGCAIVYKKSKFIQVRFVPVQFQKGGILDRDNVGIILLLKPRPDICKGTARTICVATTHLLFNPRRGDVKLAQLMLFLAEIDKVAALEHVEEYRAAEKGPSDCGQGEGKRKIPHHDDPQSSQSLAPEALTQTSTESVAVNGTDLSGREGWGRHQRYCPIILCGDFNTEPFCHLYRLITSGHLKYEGLVSRFICGQKEGRERGSDVYLGTYLLPDHLGITESCQFRKVLCNRHSSSQKFKSKLSNSESLGQISEHHLEKKFSRVENEVSDRRDEGEEPKHNRCFGSDTIPEGSGSSGKSHQHNQTQSGTACERTGSSQKRFYDKSQNSSSRPGSKEEKIPFYLPTMNSGQAYHSMNFKSAYTHVAEPSGPNKKKNWEVSSQHSRCSCTVDYIFYSSCPSSCQSEIQESQLELLARYSLPTSEEAASLGHLPNAMFPSDHLSLIAKFWLR